MFSQLNDDDFVAKIKKDFLSRKKTGGFELIISLAMIGIAGYFAYDLGHMTLRIAENISSIVTTSSDEPLREQAKKTCDEFLLIQGTTIGFLLCTFISASMHLLMHALYLLFDSRKERLLVEYSTRLQNIG